MTNTHDLSDFDYMWSSENWGEYDSKEDIKSYIQQKLTTAIKEARKEGYANGYKQGKAEGIYEGGIEERQQVTNDRERFLTAEEWETKVKYNSLYQIVTDRHDWSKKYPLLESVVDGLMQDTEQRVIDAIQQKALDLCGDDDDCIDTWQEMWREIKP